MAYRVEWSSRAIEDLEAIAQYISADSTSYAAAVVKTILQTLGEHPKAAINEHRKTGHEKVVAQGR